MLKTTPVTLRSALNSILVKVGTAKHNTHMDSIEFIENLFHRANNTKQDTFSIVGEGDVEGNTITLVKKNLDGILVKRTGGKPFEMASVDIVDNLLASSKTLVFVEKASVKK